MIYTVVTSWSVPYSGKLSREKTFTNFEVLRLFVKFFSTKFGAVALFGSTSEQFVKVFSMKILFSTNSQKFFLVKVSRCTVLERFECRWK